MTFPENMKIARLNRDWTQEQASFRIGITRSALGSYEEGRAEPSFAVLLRICEVYQVKDVKAFIGGRESHEILKA